DIFVLNERVQHRDGAVFGKWRLLVTEHVAESVFLALYQIHHRARDRLFAFEGGDAWTFTEAHSALIDLRHLGRFHSFVASFVVIYVETLVVAILVHFVYFFSPY